MYFRQSLPKPLVAEIDALKHLSTACVIVDQYARLVGVNVAATNMFDIPCLTEYASLLLEMQFYPCFCRLIAQASDGGEAHIDVGMSSLKDKELYVHVSASKVPDVENFYLFQLTEIKPFSPGDYWKKLLTRIPRNVLQVLRNRSFFI